MTDDGFRPREHSPSEKQTPRVWPYQKTSAETGICISDPTMSNSPVGLHNPGVVPSALSTLAGAQLVHHVAGGGDRGWGTRWVKRAGLRPRPPLAYPLACPLSTRVPFCLPGRGIRPRTQVNVCHCPCTAALSTGMVPCLAKRLTLFTSAGGLCHPRMPGKGKVTKVGWGPFLM